MQAEQIIFWQKGDDTVVKAATVWGEGIYPQIQ